MFNGYESDYRGEGHGMSGSPAVDHRIRMYRTSTSINVCGEVTRFPGVYFGRIHEQTDVGM